MEVPESLGVTQQAVGNFFHAEVRWPYVEKGDGMVRVTPTANVRTHACAWEGKRKSAEQLRLVDPGLNPKLQPQSPETLSACWRETGSSGAQSEQKSNLDGQMCPLFVLLCGHGGILLPLSMCVCMCV